MTITVSFFTQETERGIRYKGDQGFLEIQQPSLLVKNEKRSRERFMTFFYTG